MEFLGNSQTGPLAKTVASVLLRRNLDGWQQYWGSSTSTFGTVKRWYRGYIKKVFPPCVLIHVQSVNYPGTSSVDFVSLRCLAVVN
jgi:hypothetical protein